MQFKAHQVRNRHPDHESPQNSLKHDESRLADAVVKADMAKENRRKQTIDCMKAEEISMMNAQTFSATPTPADATTPMPFTIARIIRKEMLTSRS